MRQQPLELDEIPQPGRSGHHCVLHKSLVHAVVEPSAAIA